MKVEYIQGKSSCERCGAYIKNIFVITFDDGYSITVGSECVKKVLRETNLTEKGYTYVERLMKPIEELRISIDGEIYRLRESSIIRRAEKWANISAKLNYLGTAWSQK